MNNGILQSFHRDMREFLSRILWWKLREFHALFSRVVHFYRTLGDEKHCWQVRVSLNVPLNSKRTPKQPTLPHFTMKGEWERKGGIERWGRIGGIGRLWIQRFFFNFLEQMRISAWVLEKRKDSTTMSPIWTEKRLRKTREQLTSRADNVVTHTLNNIIPHIAHRPSNVVNPTAIETSKLYCRAIFIPESWRINITKILSVVAQRKSEENIVPNIGHAWSYKSCSLKRMEISFDLAHKSTMPILVTAVTFTDFLPLAKYEMRNTLQESVIVPPLWRLTWSNSDRLWANFKCS